MDDELLKVLETLKKLFDELRVAEAREFVEKKYKEVVSRY